MKNLKGKHTPYYQDICFTHMYVTNYFHGLFTRFPKSNGKDNFVLPSFSNRQLSTMAVVFSYLEILF